MKDKEWETEPDFLEEIDPETGYTYKIIRHPYFKNLCGYVLINKDHPLFEKFHEDVDIEVHGSLTYCGHEIIMSENHGTNKDNWYFGFDTYRNINSVKNECKILAKQLYKFHKKREIL